MAERENKKSLKDRAEEALQSVVDALQSLLPDPQPRLVPIPARRPQYPRNPYPRGRRR